MRSILMIEYEYTRELINLSPFKADADYYRALRELPRFASCCRPLDHNVQ